MDKRYLHQREFTVQRDVRHVHCHEGKQGEPSHTEDEIFHETRCDQNDYRYYDGDQCDNSRRVHRIHSHYILFTLHEK